MCSWVVGVARNYSQLYHQCANGSKYIDYIANVIYGRHHMLERENIPHKLWNLTVSRQQLLSITVRNLHTDTVLVENCPKLHFHNFLTVHGFTSHGVNHSGKDTEDSYSLIRSTESTKPTNKFIFS